MRPTESQRATHGESKCDPQRVKTHGESEDPLRVNLPKRAMSIILKGKFAVLKYGYEQSVFGSFDHVHEKNSA